MNPLRNALAHILAIGADHHFAGVFERFQRHDRRHQLHAVVGGEPVTGAKNFFMLLITQDGTVTARAGIAQARSIGENFYLFLHLW